MSFMYFYCLESNKKLAENHMSNIAIYSVHFDRCDIYNPVCNIKVVTYANNITNLIFIFLCLNYSLMNINKVEYIIYPEKSSLSFGSYQFTA